jgi:hypothetical protein
MAAAIVYFVINRNEPPRLSSENGALPSPDPGGSKATSRIVATRAGAPQANTSRPTTVFTATEVEIRKAIAAFVTAINNNDDQAVDGMLDLPRELEEMRSLGVLAGFTEQQYARLLEGWKNGYGKRLLKIPRLHLRDVKIRRIEVLAVPDEFRVYTHGLDAQSDVSVRWWLRKTGSSWGIYDYQFLTVPSLRKSRDDAFLVGSVSANHPDWCSSSDWYKILGKLGPGNDDATRLQTLDALHLVQFPPEYQSYLLTLRGTYVMKADLKEAVRHIDAALIKYPDNIVAHSVRAEALIRADLYQDAVDSVTHYIDLAGDSADACFNLGISYEALHRPADAANAYRRGLLCDPSSRLIRAGLARTSKEG